MMIFYSETLGFELEAMMCAVRDGTFSGALLTYFNDGGGRGGSEWIFRSEILAKSDFFGSMKDAGIFWVAKKKTEGFLGVAIKGLRDFCGYAKDSSDFLG